MYKCNDSLRLWWDEDQSTRKVEHHCLGSFGYVHRLSGFLLVYFDFSKNIMKPIGMLPLPSRDRSMGSVRDLNLRSFSSFIWKPSMDYAH